MPYTQNPSYSTYHTERFTFVSTPNVRRPLGSVKQKDERFINYFPEENRSPASETKQYYLRQRGGLTYHHSTTTGAGRGIYYWNGHVYSVVGGELYSNSSALQALSTSTGPVGFQEFDTGAGKKLIVLDGTSGWVVATDNTVTQITDGDFPTPHCVGAAYLDGYLCVAKSGTDDIYNCDIQDPFTWTAGSFITAEMFPDVIVALCRQTNYVVALGSQTIEFFYDAGNSPGSPFARNSAAFQQLGSPAPDTLVEVENQFIFVGQTQTGGRSVWLMDGFTPHEISDSIIRGILNNEGSDITTASATVVRSKGHKFYVLSMLNAGTWVFDFDEGMWHQWTDYTGSGRFLCDYSTDDPVTSFPYMQDRTTGQVYNMVETNTIDTTATTSHNVTAIVITRKLDFDNINRKFMSRFTLLMDVPTTSNSTYSLEYTDDDYQNWSTPRTLSLNDTMASTTQLGSFRRRAFRITYTQAYETRLEGYEVNINYGSQ